MLRTTETRWPQVVSALSGDNVGHHSLEVQQITKEPGWDHEETAQTRSRDTGGDTGPMSCKEQYNREIQKSCMRSRAELVLYGMCETLGNIVWELTETYCRPVSGV